MEGDVIGRMRLNISDFKTKLDQVDARLRSTLKKMDRASISSSAALTREIEKLTAAQKKSLLRSVSSHRASSKKLLADAERTSAGFARTWWEGFGRVALGFTLAYRAMMAFEVGLKKVVTTIGEAIKESSDLAATQAKLAFWYQMHTEESLKYADVFQMAAVNIHALGEASVYSVATLDELTTGIDELAQSVGAVPANMIPAMASMVDFTVMVAQTTGSTIRQVRQEFQALMEGRIRTTDVMARSLIKTGIMTREELKQMRDMTNQAEILEKVMNAVHERWTEARDIYREASIEAAKGFWEKALKMNIRLSVNLASELTKTGEVAGNLFAKVFVEHGKRALKDMEKGFHNNVLMMLALRSILDKLLTAFEKTLAVVAWFIASLYRLSDEIIFAVKAIGGFFILGAVTKLMMGLGKAAIWLAMGPLKILRYAIHFVNTSILRIPLMLYAATLAVQALFKTVGMSGEYLKGLFLEIPKAIKGIALELAGLFGDIFKEIPAALVGIFSTIGEEIWKVFPAPVRKILEWMVEKITAAGALIKKTAGDVALDLKDIATTTLDFYKPIGDRIVEIVKKAVPQIEEVGKTFGEKFGANFKATFLEHMKFLEGVMAPIMTKILGVSDIDYKKMLAEARKEGLEWLFKKGREESEKEQKARLRKERQLLSLIKRMNKDVAISKFNMLKQSADDEFQMRMLQIQKLTDAEKIHNEAAWAEYLAMSKTKIKEKADLEKLALLAHTTKLQEALFNILKFHAKGYYNWKKAQIDADVKAMIKAGASVGEANKWRLDELKKLDAAEIRDLKQILDLKRQIEKDFYVSRLEGIKIDANAELAIRLLRIRELTNAGKERNDLEASAFKAHAEKLLIIQGTVTDGFKRGIKRYLDTVKTGFERARDSIKSILIELESAIQTTMGDALYDAITGQLKSIQDYFQAFAKVFTRAWANMIAELLVEIAKLQMKKAAIKLLPTLFGMAATAGVGAGAGATAGVGAGAGATSGVAYNVGYAHKGGLIGSTILPMKQIPARLFENAVRLHKGLASDEFPAILQRGEQVIPKDGNLTSSFGDRTINVPISIDGFGDKRMTSELKSEIENTVIKVIQRYS